MSFVLFSEVLHMSMARTEPEFYIHFVADADRFSVILDLNNNVANFWPLFDLFRFFKVSRIFDCLIIYKLNNSSIYCVRLFGITIRKILLMLLRRINYFFIII